MPSVEFVRLTRTANSVNIFHQKLDCAREFAQLDTHIKIQFVSQNVFQVSETMDSVVVLKTELSQVVHTHTSINKDHVSQLVTPVHIQTLPAESVKLAAQTVSHVCHQLSVLAAAQALT